MKVMTPPIKVTVPLVGLLTPVTLSGAVPVSLLKSAAGNSVRAVFSLVENASGLAASTTALGETTALKLSTRVADW